MTHLQKSLFLFGHLVPTILLGQMAGETGLSVLKRVSGYDVVFKTPSMDEADSVPLGNHRR